MSYVQITITGLVVCISLFLIDSDRMNIAMSMVSFVTDNLGIRLDWHKINCELRGLETSADS